MAACKQHDEDEQIEYDYFDTCDPVKIRIEEPKHFQLNSFEYIQCNIPGPGSKRSDFSIQFCGCNCLKSCDSTTCKCLQKFGTNYDNNGLLLPHDTDGVAKPIIECNSSCCCPSTCKNRQVQRGIQIQLCVYRTQAKGWGLKTLEFIPRRKFVCEYAGEILNYEEAQRRSREMKLADDNYLLTVLEHLSNGKTVETYIDPRLKGNVGRFINHSCEPNLKMVAVRVENEIPKICLFADRDIEANEELTFTYSDGKMKENVSNVVNDDKKKCFCSSSKCIGFLPFCHTIFE